MKEKCIFTICSKNYLAQALTLKESVKKFEPDAAFFLFLADKKNDEIKNIELEVLDDVWIPGWRSMAFKYDVIEFNTSIKPFCFKKLFRQGYSNVVYLDPDTYVTAALDYIWKNLDRYSIILTPHVSRLEMNYTGAQIEESVLNVGIFNLGFAAFKNNEKGNNIVNWWCDRLATQCYSYKGLFVDQKWMNFIPCFYPDDLLICKHCGINVAIWNLHERELYIENGEYKVKELETGKLFPLLIFHFSGFDPFDDKLINRRIPRFGVDKYPSFAPLIQEYKKSEYENGYEKYSKLPYFFNQYDNGFEIMPLHRRLYRATLDEFVKDDPFSSSGRFYKNLKASKLIIKSENKEAVFSDRKKLNANEKLRYARKFQILARIFLRIIGIRKYNMLLSYGKVFCQQENQTFLMQNMAKINKYESFTVSDFKH